MYPSPRRFNLDVEAISGILGCVSIACWVVVFSPQIFENFRRGSADGLSVLFIITWLTGDVFNILGAVFQGVLPTMIILAVYYALADIVLLCQCFYYKGFTLKDKITKSKPGDVENEPDERTALLANNNQPISPAQANRRNSLSSLRDQFLSVDATHLSPATPLIPDPLPNEQRAPTRPRTILQNIFFNAVSVVLVCTAGVLGWWLENRGPNQKRSKTHHSIIQFSLPGQIFGYICAILYLGSRIPQLLLNYRRKSTEGISMLFFLFAYIGNLTYVLSILAYGPVCERRRHCEQGEAASIYWRYIAVNLPWLMGSAGTLFLDASVFLQYFIYSVDEDEEGEEDESVLQTDAQEAVVVSRSPRRAVEFDNDR